MKPSLALLIISCLLIGISACAPNPANEIVDISQDSPQVIPEEQPEDQAGDDHADIFPYLGIWFSEDRTSQLIITEANLYFHDFASNREVYTQVVAADLIENSLELRMTDIIHSGQHVGFDYPMISVQFQITEAGMQVWLNRLVITGGDQPVFYLYDEVLNH